MDCPLHKLMARKRFWFGLLVFSASVGIGWAVFTWFGLLMGGLIGGVFSYDMLQSACRKVKGSKR